MRFNIPYKLYIGFFVFVLSMSIVPDSLAEKTDIVILKNGDKITGEVKRMEFARLSFITDAMKTLSIEWDEIRYLNAKEKFRIELASELDLQGSIDTDTLRNKMAIRLDSLSYYTNFEDVVKIIPIKDTFQERLKASIDLGFSFIKASDVAQLSFNSSASYRSWRFLHEASFNAIVTSKKEENPSENLDFNWNTSRFFIYRWYLNSFTGAQKNTELGLDLRLLLGAGGGKDIFRTNTNFFSSGGGLQITQEWNQGSTSAKTNLEAVGELRFNKFQYDNPEIDLDINLQVYPNLTTFGRIRVDFNVNLKWEIYNDLFWKLTFSDNFDNQPPTEGAQTNDYSISLSLGWSY